VTIARFRVRHEQALAGFLVQSLRLCAAAGVVKVGTVALDGTNVADAANTASHTQEKIEAQVAEILRQAAEADQHEDGEHGQARGNELPAALACKTGRLARLRRAKALLEAEAAAWQRGRMMPRSTPATPPESRSWSCWMGMAAVTASHSRPPSASSVTARTCPGGYGRGRASRTHSSGWPRATGSRTRFPSSRKVPW
jgi:hypothetical protein